jgi:hypothetical protein
LFEGMLFCFPGWEAGRVQKRGFSRIFPGGFWAPRVVSLKFKGTIRRFDVDSKNDPQGPKPI